MARLTLSTDSFAVYDDILGHEHRRRLLRHVERDTYTRVNATAWTPACRLEDGHPLQGSTQWMSDIGAQSDSPYGHLIDEVARLIVSPEVVDLIGERSHSWTDLSISPWIYPQGTALTLHVDSRIFRGAMVYYLHEDWRARWGGLLAIVETEGQHPHPVFDDLSERYAVRQGLGRLVVPLPDRMVFLASDAAHMITRVDLSAGDRPRLSVGGFFQDRQTSSTEA